MLRQISIKAAVFFYSISCVYASHGPSFQEEERPEPTITQSWTPNTQDYKLLLGLGLLTYAVTSVAADYVVPSNCPDPSYDTSICQFDRTQWALNCTIDSEASGGSSGIPYKTIAFTAAISTVIGGLTKDYAKKGIDWTLEKTCPPLHRCFFGRYAFKDIPIGHDLQPEQIPFYRLFKKRREKVYGYTIQDLNDSALADRLGTDRSLINSLKIIDTEFSSKPEWFKEQTMAAIDGRTNAFLGFSYTRPPYQAAIRWFDTNYLQEPLDEGEFAGSDDALGELSGIGWIPATKDSADKIAAWNDFALQGQENFPDEVRIAIENLCRIDFSTNKAASIHMYSHPDEKKFSVVFKRRLLLEFKILNDV